MDGSDLDRRCTIRNNDDPAECSTYTFCIFCQCDSDVVAVANECIYVLTYFINEQYIHFAVDTIAITSQT